MGYVEKSTVTMELGKNYVKLEFSTGFKTSCKYVSSKRDHTGHITETHSYNGYNDEIHYLHVRFDGDIIYCQTVQTASNAGGSTWIIGEDIERNSLIDDIHGEFFNQFHLFRKAKGEKLSVLMDGKEFTEIIRQSKLKIKGN